MLTVPFFGAVVVVTAGVTAAELPAEVVVTAEVEAGAEVAGALEAGADVLDPIVGGVIVTPFSAQIWTAILTASVKYHRSVRVD